MIIEICANSFESARTAEKAGADRIELCVELSVGGLTPSFGLLEKVISALTIPVHVLIRPRTGNFTYSGDELDVMLRDIQQCKMLGAAGIVSGILTPDHQIDIRSTSALRSAASDMEFTFHRAFDWCKDPYSSLDELKQMSVTRLLSSGRENQAIDGIELLKELKSRSEECIEIMPGGGINISNVISFKESGFDSIHLSASEKIQTLPKPPEVSMHGPLEEGVISVSSFQKIQAIQNLLK